jgi:hypothetical protein
MPASFLFLHRQMFYVLVAYVIGGEEAQERRVSAGLFEGRAAFGFFALDETDGRNDIHAGFARGLNGRDGGRSRGADVVDDEHGCVFLQKAFNAAAGAVRFFCLADEEAVNGSRAVVLQRMPGAGDGYSRYDGVGSKGQAADRCRFQLVLMQQVKNGKAGEASAFGVQRGGAAIDVVVALCAGGESEVAEAEGGAGKQVKERVAVAGTHNQIRL